MNPVLYYVGKSSIDGNGCFAKGDIKKRHKIGEVVGEIIPVKKARNIAKENIAKGINRFAIWEYSNLNKALIMKNDLKFINHSCTPNIFFREFRTKIEIYALRNIKNAEELTANYGLTHHNGTLKCKCGCPDGWL